jgi:hypothetical protein
MVGIRVKWGEVGVSCFLGIREMYFFIYHYGIVYWENVHCYGTGF